MNKAAIRFLHVSPDTSAVDIYLNRDLVVQDLGYEEITDYSELEPGEYNIEIFHTGETTDPLAEKNLVAVGGEVMMAAVNGVLPDLGLLVWAQILKCPPPNRTMLRFIHFSPDITSLDIAMADSTMLVSGIEYQGDTDYLPLKAGTYDLRLKPTGIDEVVLEVPGISLKSEQMYTICTIGRLEGQPDLKTITVMDTSAYCAREAVLRHPDARPYHWESRQIKLQYR